MQAFLYYCFTTLVVSSYFLFSYPWLFRSILLDFPTARCHWFWFWCSWMGFRERVCPVPVLWLCGNVCAGLARGCEDCVCAGAVCLRRPLAQRLPTEREVTASEGSGRVPHRREGWSRFAAISRAGRHGLTQESCIWTTSLELLQASEDTLGSDCG